MSNANFLKKDKFLTSPENHLCQTQCVNRWVESSMTQYLSSKVALHFNVNYWRPYWVVNCSEAALLAAHEAPVVITKLASCTYWVGLISEEEQQQRED